LFTIGFFVFMTNPKPLVMKFGGTSVEDAAAFARVAEIVISRRELHPVIVVSAMSRMTDALVASVQRAAAGELTIALETLAPHFARHVAIVETVSAEERPAIIQIITTIREEISALLQSVSEASSDLDSALRPPTPDSELVSGAALSDAILSYGEQLSSILLAAVLRDRGVVAQQVDARRCIITDAEHGCAGPLAAETVERSRAELDPLVRESVVPVLGGFMGATLNGATTTIGRGGSDYTAALVGAALGASEIQIWTDVTGVLTADPRIVPDAHTIPRLSYAEAAELAYFGAKVLHPKTIQPAVEGDIPVRICNSRAPEDDGTLVCAESETTRHTVKAIAHKTGVTIVQIASARMLGAYGFLRALFEVFDRHRTIVDVVTTSEVSVSLSLDDASALPEIVAELSEFGTVTVENERAIICVVGEGLRGTPGIAARVFSTISDINVSLISQGASSINLTFAIEQARAREAVGRLHEAFFKETEVSSSKFQVSSSQPDVVESVGQSA
jgi:aspartate kinase